MILQHGKLILIWVSSIDMIKWVIKLRRFWKAIPELFGTLFVTWAIQSQQKTINRPDFPGGFFMPDFDQISLNYFNWGLCFNI